MRFRGRGSNAGNPNFIKLGERKFGGHDNSKPRRDDGDRFDSGRERRPPFGRGSRPPFGKGSRPPFGRGKRPPYGRGQPSPSWDRPRLDHGRKDSGRPFYPGGNRFINNRSRHEGGNNSRLDGPPGMPYKESKMEEALKDDRFKHIPTDPRFRKMPKNISKFTLDNRFKGMFSDSKFKEKCKLDKRGRPLDHTPTENLKELYGVSSDSSESEACDDSKETMKEISDNSLSQSDSSNSEGENASERNKFTKVVSPPKNSITPDKSILKNKKQNKTVIKKSNISAAKQALVGTKEASSKVQKKGLSKQAVRTTQHHLKDDDSYSDENQLDSADIKNLKLKSSITVENNESDEVVSSDEKSEDEDKEKEVDNDEVVSSDEKSEDEDKEKEVDNDDSSEDDSDESDSSDSDSSEHKTKDFDHRWEELRNDAPDTDEATRRIAVCNMDWDRIRAEDLFACFNSFKPAEGCINSVKIYPSEFGQQRMEEEKISGPAELVEEKLPSDAEEDLDDIKGQRYHREKLRQYQINRLKYYYAVVDCDSPETANSLYDQLNGMEYESSSVRFDLRFIPDDVTFDHEPSSISEEPPSSTDYKPRLFVTTALQQVKVNLTWDETDPKRRETLQKAFSDPNSIEEDLQDYLASASSESEEESLDVDDGPCEKLSKKDKIAKYRELLLSLDEKEKEDDNKYEMEITWEPGLKEKTKEIVKEKMTRDKMNPFEEMVLKKKEKRKLKKHELKAGQKQDDESSESEISDDEFFQNVRTGNQRKQNSKKLAELALMSDSKKNNNLEENSEKEKKRSKFAKNKKMQEDNFSAELALICDSKKNVNLQENSEKRKKRSKFAKNKKIQKDNFSVDVSDPRFSAIYSSHLYNIDPSDPHYKDTEGNRALIQEKQRKLKSPDSLGSYKNKKSRYC